MSTLSFFLSRRPTWKGGKEGWRGMSITNQLTMSHAPLALIPSPVRCPGRTAIVFFHKMSAVFPSSPATPSTNTSSISLVLVIFVIHIISFTTPPLPRPLLFTSNHFHFTSLTFSLNSPPSPPSSRRTPRLVPKACITFFVVHPTALEHTFRLISVLRSLINTTNSYISNSNATRWRHRRLRTQSRHRTMVLSERSTSTTATRPTTGPRVP